MDVLNGTGVPPGHDHRNGSAGAGPSLVQRCTTGWGHGGAPKRPSTAPPARPIMPAMHAAPRLATRPRARRSRSRIAGLAGPALAGTAWLLLAGATAWLVFATPYLVQLATLGRPGSAAPILGTAAWAAALTAPACLAILGVVRLTTAAHRARHAGLPLPPVSRRANHLPPDCSVFPRVHFPDGRSIRDVVLGPHGVAFFEPLPPRAAVRHAGGHWELRCSDGSWRPMEHPLKRAARDADHLRRHLAAEERDFVIRVYPAVLGDPTEVERTDGCAVVALDDVPTWLAALPAQRSLTPDRLENLREALANLA